MSKVSKQPKVDAAPVKLPRQISLEAQLRRVKKAIADVGVKICEQLFVDDLTEARKVMDVLRNEQHVRELRDEKHEMEFLQKREAMIEADLGNMETNRNG